MFYMAGLNGVGPRIIDVVTGMKVASLISLAVVGGWEMARAPNPPRLLVIANLVVLVLIIVSVLALCIKLTVQHDDSRALIQWIRGNTIFFGILPLLCYGAINIVTALSGWIRNADLEYSFRASIYLAISDIPCLLPLIMIIFMLNSFLQFGLVETNEFEFMWSGAVALFIFISSLLAGTAGFIIRRLYVR